ncbi:MAG TPA: Ig-like domain-containing protein [Gaiellaceae bacterium]|nr:Ig-like domain-containing protein [Gaiellaceae bacterium]
MPPTVSGFRLALLAALVAAVLAPAGLAALDEGNAPPVAVDDELNTARGTPGDVEVLLNDSDPDGDPLSIESWTQGAEGSVVCVGVVCSYTPTDPGYVGIDSFTYTVTDGGGGTDVGLVVVTVTYTNEQPVAEDDLLTTAEDTAGNVDVLANDSDEDGDQLTVVTEAPSADNGTVSCTPEGVCTYTPDPNFNGTDSFTYTIEDGAGGDDAGEVTVTVTPVNDDPNAVADTLAAAEDEQGQANVLANDADLDGDALTVTTPSPAAAHGSVSCTAGGTCTYTPEADYAGPDSFQYAVSDGNGGSDTATVSVTVAPENLPPVADDETLTTAEDVEGTVDVLAGDADAEGDPLSVTTPAPAATHGTVSCSAAGSCTYTPDADFHGSDSFEYTVSDGGGTDAGLVSVTVTPVNDAPVAGDDELATAEDTAGQTDVLADDTDVEGDALTVTGATNGAHGSVVCGEDGTCAYTPAADYSGADTFTYTVSDGNGGTDTGSVSVTVTPENDAPVAGDDTLTTERDVAADVDVLAGDADADGDALTVETASDPEHGSVLCDPGGLCTYTPDPGYVGADSFTYTVGDGQATDEGLVSVTVLAPNVAPSCAPVTPSRTTLGPVKRQFLLVRLSGATDGNGDPLAYSITAVRQDEKVKGIGGTVDKAPDAKRVSGKPAEIRLKAERDPKANGRVYRILYRVADGRGGTCTGVEKVGVPVKAGKKAVESARSFNSFG